MKKFLLLVLALTISSISFTQGVGVNESGAAADASAILDVSSTTKGLLVPRMTQTQRNAISSPATGLLIFQTDNTPGYYYYTGSAWTALNTTGTDDQTISEVLTEGSSANDAQTLSIDQINARDGDGLKLFNDGNEGIFITDGGGVGIGTITPSKKVEIEGTGETTILVDGNTGASTPSLAAVLQLNSNIDYRGRGTHYTTSDADDWFLGVPYTGAGFTLGRHASQPEYDANSLIFIQEDGDVGIGTTSPFKPFSVEGDDGYSNGEHILASFSRTTPATGIGGVYVGYFADGTDETGGIIRSIGALPLYLGTYGSKQLLTIGHSNNVGIGTTSPSFGLDVQIGNNDGVAARFEGTIQVNQTDVTSRAYGYLSTDDGSTMIGGNLRNDDNASGGTHDGYSKGTNARGGAGILFNNSSSGSGTFQFMSASDTDDETYTVSEFMRIDASGNVGIGTTSPTRLLHVDGELEVDGSIYADDATGLGLKDDGGNIGIWVEDGGEVGINTTSPSSTFEVAYGSSQTATQSGAAFEISGGGTMTMGTSTTYAWIQTWGGDELVLNPVGNFVGIGNTSPNVALDVSGNIEYTGTITDVSDIRLKENLKKVEKVSPSLLNLQAYKYNMIGDTLKTVEYGLIAQDVQEFFPEMVSVIDDNNHLGLSYTQLIPILIEGFKEQHLLIEELQLKVKELENK